MASRPFTLLRRSSWARDFWSPEGRYVRLRRAHGHSLSAAHAAHQHWVVQKYLLPMFAKKYLDEITADAARFGHIRFNPVEATHKFKEFPRALRPAAGIY